MSGKMALPTLLGGIRDVKADQSGQDFSGGVFGQAVLAGI